MSEDNKNNITINGLNDLSEGKLYYLDRMRMHAKSLIRAIDNGIDLAMELENGKSKKKVSKSQSEVNELLGEALNNYYISIVEDVEMLYGVATQTKML